MTATLPPAGTRTVQPSDDAPPPFQARPAGKKSQALADEAVAEIARIDGELAELATREDVLVAEKLKLMRIVRATN